MYPYLYKVDYSYKYTYNHTKSTYTKEKNRHLSISRLLIPLTGYAILILEQTLCKKQLAKQKKVTALKRKKKDFKLQL